MASSSSRRSTTARTSPATAEVGFADQSHLTRRFKQIVGVTPGRFRAAAIS